MSLRRMVVIPLWIFSLALTIVCTSPHRSQAEEKSIARPAVNLHGTFFLTPQEGWAVGQLGKIFHTTDSGKSWQEQNSKTNLLLTAVDFTDQNHGWAVGERGSILYTADGGKSWSAQKSGVTYPLFDVDFIDQQNGWAVGHWGTILFTTDGGQQWQEQPLSTVLKDRGQIEPAVLQDIIDPTTGEVMAKKGQLLSRDQVSEILDKGITDARIREDVILNAVTFFDATHGWIAGEQGRVLRTEDGGQTWESVYVPRPPKQEGAQGSDEEIMSDEELEAFGILAPLPSLYGIYFISPQQGWAVGQEGAIVRTLDGGRQWEFQPSGVQEALYDIGVIDDIGWIVGDKGTVLVSTNSGTQWKKQDLGLEYRLSWLRRLAIIPNDHSFFVGADGLVLASGTSSNSEVWIRPPHDKP
ncbi:MAG: YCF48-related protein [Candidatus Binatia bacterium]